MKWSGRSDQFYRVETSVDLAHWTAGADEYQGSGSVPVASSASGTKRFWRMTAIDRSLSYPTAPAPITGVTITPIAPTGAFVTATGPAGAYSIVAGALPDGLTLDPASGTISGTPTKPGAFLATVHATRGPQTATTVVRLLVTPPPPCLVDLGIADYSGGIKGPFPRNPWDMTHFAGRLYIGQGNSDNYGSPELNAGPMRIVSLQPDAPGFRYEGFGNSPTLPEEQIDTIKVIDGVLYIPSHDTKGADTVRNLYQRTATNDTWSQSTSTFPDYGDSWGVHTYAIIAYAGKLVLGGYTYGVSGDGGQTWTGAGHSTRCSALFTVGGTLYGATEEAGFGLDEYDPTTGRFAYRPDLQNNHWAWIVPDIQGPSPSGAVTKIVRPVIIDSRTVYLAGYRSSDHQTRTTDVYLARSFVKGAYDVVRTTPVGERPWDLLVRGNNAYLLTSTKNGTGTAEQFVVSIWQSTADLTGWTKLWTSPPLATFARSFEEVNGNFYLGLGTDDGMTYDPSDPTYTTGLKPDSGRILWLRR